eukprot:433762-Rhodomonas_salina.1
MCFAQLFPYLIKNLIQQEVQLICERAKTDKLLMFKFNNGHCVVNPCPDLQIVAFKFEAWVIKERRYNQSTTEIMDLALDAAHLQEELKSIFQYKTGQDHCWSIPKYQAVPHRVHIPMIWGCLTNCSILGNLNAPEALAERPLQLLTRNLYIYLKETYTHLFDEAWQDNPPPNTIKLFVNKCVVHSTVHVFHTLLIANTNCGAQKLRCFAGAHVFNNENQQDTFAAILSLAFNQPGKAKEWKCERGAAMTMEVGRL